MLTNHLFSRRLWVAWWAVACGTLAADVAYGAVPALTLVQVKETVTAYFQSLPDHRAGDIIAQPEVEDVLRQLAARGFRPEDSQQIIADTLAESDPLITRLRSKRGLRYMAKVRDFTLIYDRLDRVCQVRDGLTTLDMLLKLPDGEKYSKLKSELPNGVPDILELMPKRGNGAVRTIKNYGKATGRIYTESDLVQRLSRSFE
jgi:hypothetical protein